MNATACKYIVKIDGPTSAPRFWVVTAEDEVGALRLAATRLGRGRATAITIVGEVEKELSA